MASIIYTSLQVHYKICFGKYYFSEVKTDVVILKDCELFLYV